MWSPWTIAGQWRGPDTYRPASGGQGPRDVAVVLTKLLMLDAVHIWLILQDKHIKHISSYLFIYLLEKSYLTYNDYHKIFLFFQVRAGWHWTLNNLKPFPLLRTNGAIEITQVLFRAVWGLIFLIVLTTRLIILVAVLTHVLFVICLICVKIKINKVPLSDYFYWTTGITA